jgi:hypothetical protein
MSLFNTTTIACPDCGNREEVSWAASVNADRRPDLRAEVLAGSFQAHECAACGTRMRLPPHLTYIDIGRGNWVLVQSVDEIANWTTHEAEAQRLFEAAFGASAPKVAQELAEGVSPRLVFGWPPLREKILARELGLDDVILELLKLDILRNVPGGPIGAAALRLAAGDSSTLHFEVTDDDSEAVTAETEVPRSLYDDIAGDSAAWATLRDRFSGKALVDVLRFTLEG